METNIISGLPSLSRSPQAKAGQVFCKVNGACAPQTESQVAVVGFHSNL